MDELEGLLFSPAQSISTEFVNHSACSPFSNPYVAVNDPNNITLGFSISSTHVSDLWVRSQIACLTSSTAQVGILLLHKNLDIEARIVGNEPLKNRVGRVAN